MISEFKKFLLRGNVVELAVGVIIGGAFSKIVSSLIDDVITPLLLKPALEAAKLQKLEDLTVFGSVKYGLFISSTLNFLIVAFILFLVLKGFNSAMRKQEEKNKEEKKEEPKPADIVLLTEIRDLLRK